MKHLTFILMLISISAFGQNSEPSKEKTQDWIKSVVHTYSTGELKFENGKMIWDDPFDPTGFHLKHEAIIKNLGGVTIGRGTKGYKAVYMSCFEGKCVQVGMKKQGGTENFDFFDNNKFMIQLNDDLPKDLENRLIKAINYLIKLYGGNTIDDTF